MARVLVVLHPNNELRNAQRVGVHGRSSSLFLRLRLFPLALSLFLQTGRQAGRQAGSRVQTDITRYYYEVRARTLH